MSIKTCALVALGVGLLTATAVAPGCPVLVWNRSPSVPIGLYIIVGRPPHVDDYVLVRLSGKMQALAERRSYIGPNTPLLKHVAAMEGDWVCRRGQAVLVSGQQVAIALGIDQGARPLPVWQGCHQLQHGQVFVLGTHPESFDSRYFGPIDREQIAGAAIPLFIP